MGDIIYSVKEFVATKKSMSKLSDKDVNARARFKEKLIYLPLHMSNTFAPQNIEVINDIYLYDEVTSNYLINLTKKV